MFLIDFANDYIVGPFLDFFEQGGSADIVALILGGGGEQRLQL